MNNQKPFVTLITILMVISAIAGVFLGIREEISKNSKSE